MSIDSNLIDFSAPAERHVRRITSSNLGNHVQSSRSKSRLRSILPQFMRVLKTMKRSKPFSKFVVCIRNENCEDLETRKLYRVLPDKAAEADGYIRVIDESGEDYLYPEDCFSSVELPKSAEKALLSAA